MPIATASYPECRTDAHQITTETVRNMVESFGNQDVDDDIQYRICKTQDYPVVCFADELDERFAIDVICERPTFEFEPDADPYPLCYRVRSTNGHLREDIANTGEPNIADWITDRVQAEECTSRWKSSLGGCCLGIVHTAIDQAQEDLA